MVSRRGAAYVSRADIELYLRSQYCWKDQQASNADGIEAASDIVVAVAGLLSRTSGW